MPPQPSQSPAHERLGFCASCRGVLPFEELIYPEPVRLGALTLGRIWRKGLVCRRCGTIHRPIMPGADTGRRAMRYLVYAAALGLISCVLAAMGSTLQEHSRLGGDEWAAAWIAAAVSAACVLRSLALSMKSAHYEKITPREMEEIGRGLYPGMIRQDVVDEMSRRGWSAGKVRTLLAWLRPT